MLVLLGDIDADVLAKWRETRKEYLRARAALIRQVERQEFQAPAGPTAAGFVDVVFDRPPGPEAPRFVDVEDQNGRSIQYGQWNRARRRRVGAAHPYRLMKWGEQHPCGSPSARCPV